MYHHHHSHNFISPPLSEAITKNKKTNVDTATTTVKKQTTTEEPNSYLKWKGTTAGASKLKALNEISDETLITSSNTKSSTPSNSIKKNKKKSNVVISSKGRQPQPQQQQLLQVHPSQQHSLFGITDVMGNTTIPNHHGGRHIMKPELLEARRERNRKHAKKSRQRKKSLTTDLEQSLEDLKEENLKLRNCIEESFERKKLAKLNSRRNLLLATTTPDNVDSNIDVTVVVTEPTTERTVDELLESRRVRSHERFIQCIMDDTNYTNQDTDDDDDGNDDSNNNGDKDSGTLLPPSTLSTSSMSTSKPSIGGTGTGTGLLASIMNNSLSSSSPSTRSGKGVIVNETTLKMLKALSKTITCVPTISSSSQQQEQEPSPPACKRQKLTTTTTTTMLSS